MMVRPALENLVASGRVVLILCAPAVAMVLGIVPVAAAPRQANFAVTATVATVCSLGGQTAPLSFSTIVHSSGKLDPNLNNLSWTLTGLYCDSASKIMLRATALRLQPPRTSLTSSQSQAINFTATATGWSAIPATVTTAETTALGSGVSYTGVPQSQTGARSGPITIKVGNFVTSIDKRQSANSAKPIDGSYSATISVILSPGS